MLIPDFQRWMKFSLVSAMGVFVQLSVDHLLARVVGAHYLVATALALEAAILHNFAWHECFTWSDRSHGPTLERLLRFNLTTGAISISGNLAWMALLVGQMRVPFLAGHLVAIGSCSILNFLVSDRFVFVPTRCHFSYGRCRPKSSGLVLKGFTTITAPNRRPL